MRSYWSRVDPYSTMTSVLIRREETQRHSHARGTCHVMIEAEIEVLQLQGGAKSTSNWCPLKNGKCGHSHRHSQREVYVQIHTQEESHVMTDDE